MVIEHLLKWVRTALVSERAEAASVLARTFVEGELSFEDRCAAEAALTMLLDDPSSKVRAAVAEALSMSRAVPIQIISTLAADQPEVACFIIGRSPLMRDADLIDRIADGNPGIQKLVALRGNLNATVSAALAELGDVNACIAMASNTAARVNGSTFARMIERHGDSSGLREALLQRDDLPSDCRHMLLLRVGEALKSSQLMLRLVGAKRAERITRDACIKSSLSLIDGTPRAQYGALVEHLRTAGGLTASFIVRAVAHGKIDFLGAALKALSGQSAARVNAVLAHGRDMALAALMRAAGLSETVHGVIVSAIRLWREVAHGRRVAGAQEVSWLMLKALGGQNAEGELASLIRSIHVDALRENARSHALAIAAA